MGIGTDWICVPSPCEHEQTHTLLLEEKTLSSSPRSFPLGPSERGMPRLPELTIRLQNLTLRKGAHETEGVLDNWGHQGGAHPLSQSHTGGSLSTHNSKNKHLGVLVVAENMN